MIRCNDSQRAVRTTVARIIATSSDWCGARLLPPLAWCSRSAVAGVQPVLNSVLIDTGCMLKVEFLLPLVLLEAPMDTATTDGVTVGLVLPAFDTPERIYAAARTAEAHQFHSVWAPDATLPGYPWLDSLTVLGGVVALTTRVQVGTSILVLARRNPVLLAHRLATLDYLSGGRFSLGVGVADPALRPNEYAVAGVPVERRGRITDEYLGLFQRLFTESGVTHAGP